MKNLMTALSAFQLECPIIHKDTQGHKYTYADLPKIYSVINPLLHKHGLVVAQPLVNGCIETILYHLPSDECMKAMTPIPQVSLGNMNDYQAFGSGVTYYRRYALSSMLGLVTDKDTDAAGTQVVKERANISKVVKNQEPEDKTAYINDVTMLKLVARFNAGEEDVFDKAAKHFVFREKDLATIEILLNDRAV
jgi:hypothetical protein